MAQVPVAAARPAGIADGQSYRPALVTLAVLYFMMGLITCLNDTLVPFFKNSFQLNYTQSALVQFYFFVTYGIMSIPAGIIVSKFGFKQSMVAGFAIAAVGTFLFYPASLMHQYYLFLAALFILAIGIVLLQVAANPYITLLGPPETASSRFNLIQALGSLGTTVAPLLGASYILSEVRDGIQSSEAVRLPYLCITALVIVIAFVISQLKLPSPVSQATDGGEGQSGIFGFRNLRFGLVALFCYVGAEVSIGSFLTNYIADTAGIVENEAVTYVALYWGSMLVGRFLGAGVLKIVRAPLVLSICAIAAVVLIVVSVTSTGMLAAWTMVAVGLCNSIMFATIFSLSVAGLEEHATRASGWLSTAIVGGAVVSFLQGVLIDHFNWQVAFMLPLLCYVFILFFGLNGYKTK
ncbi:FHS family L-fucose permease-like MFS transporter [Dyadobacter sp. BE34]|uniref:FHS family L-fucose permease-like MFS transporter n=1 Tax=Dyadobacter fermentans TaxID=94254 RepID=A0ABU1QT82_9BACT|nr:MULTISPECIES: sugar MFS transporter [Dyadobacter]MDR6804363.1 FHS family L-fucose permease-like MFS transporter [Dyadobacter fermentans]MDR7042103.1 FHS family L-fucose permease-like MFS transporter [Dyadobacter sp. BE242]MDR7196506.1 FHS family L-fucose permease-like MFS transporter [Dyadobacter sp. BE34]MDR7212949.1 FHS family L-fucose permease-like MFS transporter [Dyadobacter sp. BE31]MDR7261912.1 FHS family L-fucose permease-like MFS transporter [Dyadobacter sp. BE32]